MTARAFPSGRPPYLAFLPRFLFSAEGPVARYVFKAWLLALLPSLLIAALIGLVAPNAPAPEFAMSGPLFLALLVVVGPLLETLLMIAPLWALNRLAGAGFAAIGSALLWGVLHSLVVPIWGLVVWWPFLILSIAFLTWRARGIGMAILVTALVHGLQNAVAAALPLVAGMNG